MDRDIEGTVQTQKRGTWPDVFAHDVFFSFSPFFLAWTNNLRIQFLCWFFFRSSLSSSSAGNKSPQSKHLPRFRFFFFSSSSCGYAVPERIFKLVETSVGFLWFYGKTIIKMRFLFGFGLSFGNGDSSSASGSLHHNRIIIIIYVCCHFAASAFRAVQDI